MQTYFFLKDDDGHWYQIPSQLKREFIHFVNGHSLYDFDQYRLPGGIEDIEVIIYA